MSFWNDLRTRFWLNYMEGKNIRGFLQNIFLALILLIVFLNGFVFIEPAPVDYLLMFSIPFFVIFGKMRIKPLLIFLFLSFINLLLFLVTANVLPISNFRFLIINLYMFLTFFLFSMINLRNLGDTFFDKLFLFWTLSVFVNFFFYGIGTIISKSIFLGASVISFEIRFQGFFKDPNVNGPFIIVPLMYWINKFFVKHNFTRFLIILFLSSSLFFTFSRGAYLNFVVAFLVNVFLIKRLYFKIKLRCIPILAFVAGVIFVVISTLIMNPIVLGVSLRDFVLSRFQIIQPYDIKRFEAQRLVSDLVDKYPLFGVGIGNYNAVVNYAAHNSYVRILGEMGVIAFAFYVFVLIFILVDRFSALRGKVQSNGILLYSCFIGILIESLFIDTLHWRFLWIIVGLLYAL